MINIISLKGKICFISGAAGGLGECVAKRFAKEGCNLFLTDINDEKLEKLKNDIESSETEKIEIFYASGDFEKLEDINKVLAAAKDKMGRIDILANCLGINQFKTFINTNIKDFDRMFNLNVRAPYILCNELSKQMVENKWGRIVNIGSTGSYESYASSPLYCASKHAILGLTRAMHQDLFKFNVRSYCVSPAAFKSEMGYENIVQFPTMDYNTFIEPEEIADYIIYAVKFNGTMVSEEIRLHMLPK